MYVDRVLESNSTLLVHIPRLPLEFSRSPSPVLFLVIQEDAKLVAMVASQGTKDW